MTPSFSNILALGIKELYSLRRDPVLVFLILYTFTMAIYTVATGVRMEVRNATIAFVDEDGSELSRRLRGAFLLPFFKTPALIGLDEIDRALDDGRYSFVIDIPPHFERDVQAGRGPSLQVNVDATAMTLAGNGTAYIANIINQELRQFVGRNDGAATLPIGMAIRAKFNPNLDSVWFTAVMQLVNNVTVLAIILAGAAVIREREHGTLEHLMVMPVTPLEIMAAKLWANGLVIVITSQVSLWLVVGAMLGVPLTVSASLLFGFGTAIYLFSVLALGILLSTIARSMPQFGLLSIPVFVVMEMLSGGITPVESMPGPLQAIMRLAPSTHFTSFAQAVLYRGAGVSVVWPQLLAVAAIGGVFLMLALARFRATMSPER